MGSASRIVQVSTRDYRRRSDAAEDPARQAMEVLRGLAPEDPLSALAYWRLVWDDVHSEMYEAASEAREANIPWAGLAVAYDRSEASTYSKFGRDRDRSR